VTKILERSPLKYGIVRSISCLVSGIVSSNRQLAESRMKNLTDILFEKGHITVVAADRCYSQFTDLCSKASGNLLPKFKDICRTRDRLDTFYSDITGRDPDVVELYSVMRQVFV
jgi:hypothetical protein